MNTATRYLSFVSLLCWFFWSSFSLVPFFPRGSESDGLSTVHIASFPSIYLTGIYQSYLLEFSVITKARYPTIESRDERHRDAFDRTLARLRDRSENIRSSLPFNFKAIRDELVNQPIPTGPFILTREQKEVGALPSYRLIPVANYRAREQMIRGGQPVDDEVAEERVEEPEPMDFQVPEGFVVVENDTFSLDDYLGDQWVKTHIVSHTSSTDLAQ